MLGVKNVRTGNNYIITYLSYISLLLFVLYSH